MEPEVRERFERIEATLALTAENHRLAMEELDKRMAAGERRMAAGERRMAASEKRMAAHENSMAKFDRGLEGLRKLVTSGMRVVNHNIQENGKRRDEIRAFRAEMKEFKNEVRAYIRAQGNGHKRPDGNGRH